jgi:hypothetical protein
VYDSIQIQDPTNHGPWLGSEHAFLLHNGHNYLEHNHWRLGQLSGQRNHRLHQTVANMIDKPVLPRAPSRKIFLGQVRSSQALLERLYVDHPLTCKSHLSALRNQHRLERKWSASIRRHIRNKPAQLIHHS